MENFLSGAVSPLVSCVHLTTFCAKRKEGGKRVKVLRLYNTAKNKNAPLAKMSVWALAVQQKKDYNGIINRVRPCALSAASTGSCAADEGIDRGAGSASRCCMDLGAGESRLRFLPGSECCWNSRPPLCGLSQGRAFFASCLLFLFKEDNYNERQKNFGAYPDHAGPAG